MDECLPRPVLERRASEGVHVWTDVALRERAGVVVAFSERGGGVSSAPYASLNIAGHVGDIPAAVDENRRLLLDALDLTATADHLTTCEQVHGSAILVVDARIAGSGARVARGAGPLPATDALITGQPGIPLLLCFADCVPIVLVAPGPAIAVVHAGWRGALAGLPGDAALALAREADGEVSAVRAYIGPHIGPCHYQVSSEIMSQFIHAFGTVARAESGALDLGAVVNAFLIRSGVDSCNIAALGTCTAESTEHFFSYRAEAGLTGRHGALACILP